jgi:hypothetical protein
MVSYIIKTHNNQKKHKKWIEPHPEFIKTHEDMECVCDMSEMDGYCHLCGWEPEDWAKEDDKREFVQDHFAEEHDFYGGV